MSEEFNKVKLTNNLVSRVLERGGTLEDCIVALDIYGTRLEGRIFDLMTTAPKKIKTSDGIFIWRCPDELIPVEDLTK